jgi:type II secretory pathway pseudopilin PulG
MASITIMLIFMAALTPGWKYILANDREEELLFRGISIARAIEQFQKKNGNALPPSLEALVQGKHLRKLYKDPMTKGGKWRFVRQGETTVGTAPIPGGSPSPGASPSPSPSPSPDATSSLNPQSVGVVAGVATTNTGKTYRVFNGRTRYNEWLFIAGQPRVIGRPTAVGPVQPNANPFASPSPRPNSNVTPSPASSR